MTLSSFMWHFCYRCTHMPTCVWKRVKESVVWKPQTLSYSVFEEGSEWEKKRNHIIQIALLTFSGPPTLYKCGSLGKAARFVVCHRRYSTHTSFCFSLFCVWPYFSDNSYIANALSSTIPVSHIWARCGFLDHILFDRRWDCFQVFLG